MKKTFLAAALIFGTMSLTAQTQGDWTLANNTTTNNNTVKDLKTIDGVIQSFYGFLSGKPGQRNWEQMKKLCLPKAQFNTVRYNTNGEKVNRFGSMNDYISNTNTFFRKNHFSQTELNRKVDQYDHIATVYSDYQATIYYTGSQKTVNEAGLMTFQMVNANGRWWISSITWNTQRPGTTTQMNSSGNPNPGNINAPTNSNTTAAAPEDGRVMVDRPIRFESGIVGEIFNESEVGTTPQFGDDDAAIFKAIGANLQYPTDATNAAGTYNIEFIVDTEGWVNNVKVYNAKSQAMVDEIMKAMNAMPKWTAAKKDGKDVNCRVTLQLNIDPK